MGNENKPARDHFRGMYFDHNDSISTLERDDPYESEQKDRFSGRIINSSYDGPSRDEYQCQPSYRKSPDIDVYENNILPADIFAKGSIYMESTHRRSRKQQSESLQHNTLVKNRDLMKVMSFVQGTLNVLQPNVDFVDEVSDAFLLRLKCYEGIKTTKPERNLGFTESRSSKGNDASYPERDDDSRFDEEEFLNQLRAEKLGEEPYSPLEMTYAENQSRGSPRDLHVTKSDIPTDRSQLFARYFYDDADLEDPTDLLSPIKPRQGAAYNTSREDNCDRGSLEVFIKPKKSRQSELIDEPKLVEPTNKVNHGMAAEQFKHKYFNTNPFEKLFKDITNTPTTVEKCMADNGEVNKISVGYQPFNRSPVGLPPKGKENTNLRAKKSKISRNRGDRPTDRQMMTIDLRAASKARKSCRDSSQSRNTRESQGYSELRNKSSKGPHSYGESLKTPAHKHKQQKVEHNYPLVSEFDQEPEREDLWLQIQAELSNQERQTTSLINKDIKPKDIPNQGEGKSKPKINARTPTTLVTNEDQTEFNEDYTIWAHQDCSQMVISEFQGEAEQPNLSKKKHKERLAASQRHDSGQKSSLDMKAGQTESRHEMARMMQGYQLDSGQKYREQKSQQSDQPAFKLSVNIHKLSEQAMMDIADLG